MDESGGMINLVWDVDFQVNVSVKTLVELISLLELLNRSCVRWYPSLHLPLCNECLIYKCARGRGTLILICHRLYDLSLHIAEFASSIFNK